MSAIAGVCAIYMDEEVFLTANIPAELAQIIIDPASYQAGAPVAVVAGQTPVAGRALAHGQTHRPAGAGVQL